MAPFSRYLAAVVNYKTFWSSGTTRPYSAPFVIDAEPYFISNTAEHLTFDERYVAWGGDKAEQFHRVMLQVIKARDNALVHTSRTLAKASYRMSSRSHAYVYNLLCCTVQAMMALCTGTAHTRHARMQ